MLKSASAVSLNTMLEGAQFADAVENTKAQIEKTLVNGILDRSKMRMETVNNIQKVGKTSAEGITF